MLGVAEGTGRIVHRAYDITREGQRGIMRGCTGREGRHVIIPLSPIDTLRRKQVRIGALPTAGNGCPMEVHQQMVSGGTFQQVLTIVHVLLVIAREEVNLHAGHTDFLAPGKLALAILWFVQTEFRSWSAVDPAHTGVIPDERFDALLTGIGNSILDGLAFVGGQLFHLVPLGVDKHIGQMQRGGHVHIFLDDAIVVGAVVVGPIDPRHHTGLYPVRIIQLAWFTDIRNQRRRYDIGQRAHDNHAPRGMPVASNPHLVLGRHHTEALPIIIKTGGALLTLNVCLRDQGKHTILRLQQSRIAPTLRLHLTRCALGEEALIGLCPLLHPAARPLRDAIDCLLLRARLVLQS